MATRFGDILVAVDTVRAPITAANFLAFVDAGKLDGGSFYRSVVAARQPEHANPISVIQGALHPWFAGNNPRIALERTRDTGLRHLDGAISMARGRDPDSATSSFFICIGDQPSLDFGGGRNPDGQGFAAFGRVVEGMEAVRRINELPARGELLVPPVAIIGAERVPREHGANGSSDER